ncbi:MAG: carboxylating nicotinate-nucleotide diphosphorylase [Myxococcota bacterium]
MTTEWKDALDHADVQMLVDLALREDIGAGDVTTQAIFRAPQRVQAKVVARTSTVVCGGPLALSILRRFDPHAEVTALADEGTAVPAGSTIFTIDCDVRALLTAERTLLNFLMRLCGVAANAHRATSLVPPGSTARIYDTRKTLPAWRQLDKLAVRIGGGSNHRIGLFDAVLIKDNHIAAAGSITKAVAAARAWRKLPVEVEVDSLAQLDEALVAKADIILLDNFSLADIQTAVARVGGKAELEVSGGVTYERIPELAATGVQRISMGALTHTVTPADLGLDMP